MTKKQLSSAAEAVWEAYNLYEPGVFVSYADCLAEALKAVANEIRFQDELGLTAYGGHLQALQQVLGIAAELEG